MIRFALLAALAVASPASARQCIGMNNMAAALKKEFGEQRRFEGMSGGVIAELWVNDDSGTWTLFMVTPQGLACVVAAGTSAGWVNPAPQGEAG
jgi:hypothetical protein